MKGNNGWLYHLCPEEIIGDKLLPLNSQRKTYPSLYAKNVGTYIGREHVMSRQIPLLNCLWNDVLHMTNIPPSAFFRALKESGRNPNPSLIWLKVPVTDAIKSPTVVYSCRTTSSDRPFLPPEEVTHFDPVIFSEGAIDQRTLDYYRTQIKEGRKLLLFQGIAHFLIQGEITLSRCQTLRWNEG